MVQVTIWAYKAFSRPHFANRVLTHNNAISGFFRDFRGFMGLRFICLSSAFSFAEKGDGKMNARCVLEEKAREAVKVVKGIVFQPISERENTTARAD